MLGWVRFVTVECDLVDHFLIFVVVLLNWSKNAASSAVSTHYRQ